MRSVARILAVWLTPAVVLAVPAALAARGPDGLWLGLVVTLAPLIALAWGTDRPVPGDHSRDDETLFPVCRGGCQVVSCHAGGRFAPDPECPRVLEHV